jgi:hypothetical protein
MTFARNPDKTITSQARELDADCPPAQQDASHPARGRLITARRSRGDGLPISPHGYTVAQAVTDWLTYSLSGLSQHTRDNYTALANVNVTPTWVPASCAN